MVGIGKFCSRKCIDPESRKERGSQDDKGSGAFKNFGHLIGEGGERKLISYEEAMWLCLFPDYFLFHSAGAG